MAKSNPTLVNGHDLSSSKVFLPNSYDTLIDDNGKYGDEDVVFQRSDIYLMLSQKKAREFENMTEIQKEQLMHVFKQSPSAQVTKNLKDSEIFDTIKSRYIQSNADLYHYLKKVDEEQESQELEHRLKIADAKRLKESEGKPSVLEETMTKAFKNALESSKKNES